MIGSQSVYPLSELACADAYVGLWQLDVHVWWFVYKVLGFISPTPTVGPTIHTGVLRFRTVHSTVVDAPFLSIGRPPCS